ncbi:ATPase [Mesorhizobium sp. L-8-10]|uniref:AAA family ATPase n=1 Tax=Mesorhizobium sp. L-8-10 TaxID=2744523 RepID=UPI001928A879|nr:AAA family ATPase [Mesorhizobium sp. L-8-10]BCH33190.1 ATPase [Mesorhizobium sp. L-8-10]
MNATVNVAAANQDALAVTAELARRLVEACIERDKPVWLWGKPGIGKSQIVSQIALAHGARLIDMRLSMRGAEDMLGVPFPDLVAKVTEWLPPAIWPRVEGEKVYIFFDEMDRAAAAVLNAALQIVLDRKAGELQLPKSVRIIAAGNGSTDRVGTNKISSALANRFTHIYMKPDAETLARYYMASGAPAVLPAFLRYRPNLVHGEAIQGEHGSPSSRAWSTVADYLDLSDAIRGPLVRGTVGTGAGDEFEAFFRVFRELPPIASLIADPTGSDVPTRAGAVYAVASAIARVMDFGNVGNCITYLDRLPVEFRIMAMKDATRRNPALKECQPVINWRVANQNVDL